MNPSLPGRALNANAKKILHLMSQGLSDKGIADRLGLSIHTVKWYNRSIFSELQAGNRSHAIAIARESHLLGLSQPDSVRAVPVQNFPVSTTSFVGRRQELEVLEHLLETSRLLTLIGPPGSGKTRLGMELARNVIRSFPDGIWYVSLASLNETARVIPAVAETLGIVPVRGQSLAETIKVSLAERCLLLVLDNFEHLLGASLQLGWLLSGVPELKLLVTSREALDLYGEQVHAVMPLTLEESITLFLSRARAAHSTFVLNDQNEADIENICRVLEGLPLAIELAAARTKIWPPKTLVSRLKRKLDTLSVVTRDVPVRHQTLRNTIGWSYRMLGEKERLALLWLTVLKGPTTLEVGESLLSRLGDSSSASTVEALFKKSLLQITIGTNGEFCLSLLEIVKEYVLEQGSQAEIRKAEEAHAVHFLAMAVQAQQELRGPTYRTWLETLGNAQQNLDAALEWWFIQPNLGRAAEMVHALRDYWITPSHCLDGIEWTQRLLVRPVHLPAEWRAKILVDRSFLAYYSGQTFTEGPEGRMLDEALVLLDPEKDPTTRGWALTVRAALGIGNPSASAFVGFAKEGTELFRRGKDLIGMTMALCILGELERTQGNDDAAERAYRECLGIVRQTGEVRRETMILCNLGFLERHRGNRSQAMRFFVDGIRKTLEYWYESLVLVTPLFMIAGILADEGRADEGARLLGAANHILETKRIHLQSGDSFECVREAALVQAKLSDDAYEIAATRGQLLSPRQALELAVELGSPFAS